MRSRFVIGGIVGVALLCAAAAAAFPSLPTSIIRSGATAAGPGFVDSFTVACADSATLIQPEGGAMVSYSCQTPASAEAGGTTLIAVGDSQIGDPALATRNSPAYSGDTIREWGGDARLEYCRADTGTVTIFCRALVSTTTAP
jgi:hypothetical protein